jgi:hypothetical protein
MRTFRCDHCNEQVDEPICVDYPIRDEDDDVVSDEAHLCGWTCLVAWAMSEALDQRE